MRKLLIAGAGFVGQALAERMLAAGQYQVSILRRRAVPLAGALGIQADLLQPETLEKLDAVDDVVYCAAADGSDAESYRQIYAEGLANLVRALRKRGGYQRLVYVSSTSVYAEKDGAWVDESSTHLVKEGPSRFMLDGEELLQTGAEDYCILRMGGIYGPGRTYFLRRVRDGAERLYSQGGIYSNRIHRDDCVGMIQHVLAARVEREVFNGVDCDPADRNVVIRWMAEQLGLNPADLPATDDAKQIAVRGNKRVSNQKILKAGYRFIYPGFREGYTALLDEVRSLS